MSEDVRTLIKLVVVSLIALYLGVRYYRVVKADEAKYRARRYVA